jgi:hypothetical protein
VVADVVVELVVVAATPEPPDVVCTTVLVPAAVDVPAAETAVV